MAQSQSHNDPFQNALDLQKQGRWQESIQAIEIIIRSQGAHPVAYYISALAYEKLGDLQNASMLLDATLKVDRSFMGLIALGRVYLGMHAFSRAVPVLAEALEKKPDSAEALYYLGTAYMESQNHAKAEELLTKANNTKQSADILINLGVLKLRTLRTEEAIVHFSDAIGLDESRTNAWEYLGHAYFLSGKMIHAILIFNKLARENPNNLKYRNELTEMLLPFRPDKFEQVFEDALNFCLQEKTLTLDNLNFFFAKLISIDPKRPLLQSALQMGSYEIFAEAASSKGLAEFDDALFYNGLTSFIIRNTNYERVLSWLRRYLLENQALASAHASLTATLAGQCFLNEYVMVETPAERVLVEALENKLQHSIAWSDESAADMMTLASYRPLYPLIDRLPLLSAENIATAPDLLKPIMDDQITTLQREKDFGKTIPAFGKDNQSADAVSQAVREMYEENPYPRWKSMYRSDIGVNTEINVSALKANATNGKLEILVAGCGTGRHVFITQANFPDANITAIDLSRASLGFAKMRCVEHGIENVTFMQGNILELGSIDKQFDIIECAGVLHHMEDPMQGWRILNSLLKPGGAMYIGLYSETARKDIVAARAFIAEHGYEATLKGIRSCREDLKALPLTHPARRVINNPDFFSTSVCRDLIFHVQEHRFTIPQIKDCLNELGLEVQAFNIGNTETLIDYRKDYPNDPRMQSLDNWHTFEQKHPHTFANMYQFWCLKK